MRTSPRNLTRLITLLCISVFSSMSLFAQRSAHWKTFRVDGTYAAAISASPRGNIIVKNGDSHTITIYDGYSRSQVTTPDDNNYRVYESKSGQLWSTYPEGLMQYARGKWSVFPIQEIRAEMNSNLMRRFRQISLLPAEVDHVLILLSDRLLEFDAGSNRLMVLKKAGDMSLGPFYELQEGRDGIWISASNGVAHATGPLRRLTPASTWVEAPLPSHQTTGEAVGQLQRPFEAADGTLDVLALALEKSNERFLLQLKDRDWSIKKIEGEKFRQVWPAWDNTLWGYSYNALFRIIPENPPRLLKEPGGGAHYDLATQTNGVFWIGSSDGFIRYAPYTWRTPAALEIIQGPIHALHFARRNPKILWMAGTEGLFHYVEGNLEHIRWPDDFESVFQPTDTIYELRDGSLVITASGRALVFHPGSRQFEWLLPRQESSAVLGQFLSGALCVRAIETGKTNSPVLYRFQSGQMEPLFLSSTPPPELAEANLFFEAASGDFWFATASGLLVLREPTKTFEKFGLHEGLLPERIFCLADVGDGRLWAGGSDKLFELRGRKWETILNGVDRVNMISKAGDGSIWIATANGVYHQTADGWLRNNVEEGLPGDAVYKIRAERSQMVWAATSRGIAVYHPDADIDPPKTLDPLLRQPEVPSTIEPTVIAFRAVDKWDYTSPDDLLFSWRMDEGNWSLFSNTTIRAFPNLSSGNHRLEVRSMDLNGNKDSNTAMLAFSVIVPWFQDPRLLAVSVVGVSAILFFAGLAVNRNFRLKRSYAEVEKIVTQRTSELERANQELLHSQKMRAIGTMAAGIAHDFNNILSIIKGSSQIIESNLEDHEKIRTRVNRIQTVVEQGAAIVQALLGLGRLNEKELQECSPGVILEETRKVLADRFPEAVTINVEAQSPLPKLLCSRDIIQQMLINLILNAVDAMGNKGAVLLKASIRSDLPPDLALEPQKSERYIFLSVSDTGAGISPESLARIFEPFYTTKAFSSRRGTGLGLSMVYELAKGMGYGLEVQSKVGQGSSFTIVVPSQFPPA
jgi:signal transduction histidine kinase